MEGFLRLMPVMSGLRMGATSAQVPYAHYLPDQSFVYSFGWAFTNAHRGVTNDLGFVNSRNTAEPGGILVIGDSYIESQMLAYKDTLQGRLESKLPAQVCAVAASGNNLADSLQIIESFAPKLRPATIVIFVEPTDLSDLLAPPAAGHNGFVVVDANEVAIAHSDYIESTYKKWILKSALVRYAYYNLKLPEWLHAVLDPKPRVGDDSQIVQVQSMKVLKFYFARLRALSATYGFTPILLVDGDRRSMYASGQTSVSSRFKQERKIFLELAAVYRHEGIDLDPVFSAHWQQYRQRLDWLPIDGHWNAIAHALAAAEVFQRVQGPQPSLSARSH